MCPIHHDVIDSDEESYTVDRLQKIKKEHEEQSTETKDTPETILMGFINNINSDTINHGSLIFTQGQMGGQVAHSITNFGHQPRQISRAAANVLIAKLKECPPEKFAITSLMGDAETYQTASIIEQILKAGGWTTDGISQSLFAGVIRNIIIEVPEQKEIFVSLLNWFGDIGFKPAGNISNKIKEINIIVGALL